MFGCSLLSSGSSGKAWSWEEMLNEYPREEGGFPGAAPVSAFKFQKAPLSPYWDWISFVGTVGEVALKAHVDNYVPKSKEESLEFSTKTNRKENQTDKTAYWFVEVVQFEGYLVKVRFLGSPSQLENDGNIVERWIHYDQMQEIGYYEANNGICTPPSCWETSDNLTEESLHNLLYTQMTGKFTVHPLRIGWLKQADEFNRWKTGAQRVEVRNRDCCTEMLPGFVSKTRGKRVEILYWGIPGSKRKGIWVHEDSDWIKPPGWTKAAGGRLSSLVNAKSYDPKPLEPTQLGVDLQFDAIASSSFNIKVGMLFEFINPVKLNRISVGKITKVLSHGYFNCRIESSTLGVDFGTYSKGWNEFHYHITSDQLFPLGTFIKETPSPRPVDAEDDEGFKWEEYLLKTGLEALLLPKKTEENIADYEEYMWIEAVDTQKPELVCPAMILKIVHPYAMKIRFLGRSNEFDQWKPMKSLEIYPIGWCLLSKYPLEPPRTKVIVESPVKQTSPIVTTDTASEILIATTPIEFAEVQAESPVQKISAKKPLQELPVPASAKLTSTTSAFIFSPGAPKRRKVKKPPPSQIALESSLKQRLRSEFDAELQKFGATKVTHDANNNHFGEEFKITPTPAAKSKKKPAIAQKRGKSNISKEVSPKKRKGKKLRVISSSEDEG